jgi:hypothetical protein
MNSKIIIYIFKEKYFKELFKKKIILRKKYFLGIKKN